MAFQIGFEKTRGQIGVGRITLGDFTERFESCFCVWGPEDYLRHWRLAARRLTEGKAASLFITSIHHPREEAPTFFWPAWRVGGEVVFLNELRPVDRKRPFNLAQPFRHVARKRPDFSNRSVSQWRTRLAEIAKFLGSSPS